MLKFVFVMLVCLPATCGLGAETFRDAVPLVEQLEAAQPEYLAEQVRLRGDAKRGGLVFFKSAANCVGCHASGSDASPLGPNLASLGAQVTSVDVIDGLLRPSQHLQPGYETYTVLTTSGQVHVGLLSEQNEESVTLRLANSLDQDFVLSRADVEAMQKNSQSMMPDGLIGALRSQAEFLDLVAYVLEVARGGVEAADRLRPSAEQLAVTDDSANLDHAGILSRMRKSDFEAGERLFQGDCASCHGADGDTPSLATARAFGNQELKFGSDPYRMFMTLTHGNGLMAPMTYLTPYERYQVVHYIREAFMKDRNPDYFKVDKDYLASLPEGTDDGLQIEVVERDFGPALGSQLRSDFPSVLNIALDEMTVAFDLHTMGLADVWTGGFLDLSETQHIRPRGEGTANPIGQSLPALAAWQWGHEGALDYSREDLLPRGPLPPQWMDYHGYYLHDQTVVMSYSIDGREILHRVESQGGNSLIHHLEIAPGPPLVLRVCDATGEVDVDVTDSIAVAQTAPAESHDRGQFTIATFAGDVDDMAWQSSKQARFQLTIPTDSNARSVQVCVGIGDGDAELSRWQDDFLKTSEWKNVTSLQDLIHGGDLRWPQLMQTVGYQGLEQTGYALDTLTRPSSTPWNTWFRTSALDFYPDGRMVVATYGGDIWVVSGVDATLLNLRWKRYASGLYEPFGVKVVGGDVYVTCKDRLVRLQDLNEDGEADFYESFSADTDVSTNFHAFNFDLQTDDEGNFYYAKSGHGANFSLPGAVWKISPDGKQREVICTGFRSPNGMGSMPGSLMTVSDNQGQWIPASKICLIEPGAFYGWVPTYSAPPRWAPDGGEIDITKVVPPASFDQPLVWMPQSFDNSSGGQLWAGDSRFGPLANHLLHMSFGKGWLSYLMIQDVGEDSQAAIVKLPFDFSTGIMRGSVNPADGQVYVAGLQGWNGGGRAGLADGGVQRLRYTGIPPHMITDARVVSGGLQLDVNFDVDPDSANEVSSFVTEQWNYHWSRNYGSDQYVPSTGEQGTESLEVTNVRLEPRKQDSGQGTRIHLSVPAIGPVDQLRMVVQLRSENGESFEEEIYWTIHAVPASEK
ncbi:DUF6797 domain-containing protein [Allorhodopirellula heiligendammensis]|uniref:Cytochrome c6 n=1 Tax=Allorhodopirellula heiligendammensis TaxID=2714739 RepID=A0A5C6C6L9_9BACT|nr:DUF6797 domain-containing protein [Allorhodopirellula heiligendammensis]TWU19758.1 Cytochrome c6 [Allorhodopirellula heiligendammensis]